MPAFRDFNFKLLVIEKLMYEDETLTPAFSIDECLRAKGIEDAQLYAFDNDLAYTVLDESRAYFEALEISEELLATVDTLLIDGGHQVYYECSPVWDGEDDLFDVGSLDDLDLLPNLRLISGAQNCGLGVPFKAEILTARGIASD
ncbi:hypothetical protein OG298_19855 [Streptomyces sp. NBC_01005]|uniref:DUF6892 domain-containing protein n=1 Tax=unclassified Streptomyces TaxID=2593676 RepID=UPI002259F94C|nr:MULTISPECIES: hypothetical protein [unclassified Streptomyces]WSW06460.1 hypothetical protein OG298_19855 [Streptomyces sp. NBC_01005]WTB55697.1 hypothetical protein OG832_22365 [Streptomyces sp. NBC_00826]WTC95964.1 hypothetical protein OH736_19870 [Streptomyces sp. NBC_01650]WTH91420.1 hypothetical protein OIC43_21330 [Streptomyces sp. NBC_00825]WTI00148.1 hypothetical protein OHA23_21315 [Streptomyces sp. NBC_00822]